MSGGWNRWTNWFDRKCTVKYINEYESNFGSLAAIPEKLLNHHMTVLDNGNIFVAGGEEELVIYCIDVK
jgi:hypothetical protein